MFVLSQIEHNLPMPPHLLSRPLLDAIKAEIERLFLDKVVANLGLCVSVYDILAVEGGFIFPGEGCSTYKVSFRLLMFRPFTREVLVGKISGYDDKGLQVSLDFFSDICIPAHLMQSGTVRGEDGRWMWIMKTEDGDDGVELYLDIDDEIRFLVSSIKYPPIPVEQKEDDKPFAPMQINGSIHGDGLGLLAWWAAGEEGEEEEEEEEEAAKTEERAIAACSFWEPLCVTRNARAVRDFISFSVLFPILVFCDTSGLPNFFLSSSLPKIFRGKV